MSSKLLHAPLPWELSFNRVLSVNNTVGVTSEVGWVLNTAGSSQAEKGKSSQHFFCPSSMKSKEKSPH